MIRQVIRSVLAIALLALTMILSVSLAMVLIPIILVGAYFVKRKFNQIVAAQQSQMSANANVHAEAVFKEQSPQQSNGKVIEAEYSVVDDDH